jgi:hypothetical protein
MLLEALDNSFQHSIEDVDADFAMCRLRRYRSLVQKGEKLGPSADWYLDASDSSNNAGSRVADESTK